MNIVGVGMCTPLGIRWATSAAEMDAGTLRFGETQIETEPGEHLKAVRSPLLPIGMDRTLRSTALAVTGLCEALQGSEALATATRQLSLVLALPAADDGAATDTARIAAALVDEARAVKHWEVREPHLIT